MIQALKRHWRKFGEYGLWGLKEVPTQDKKHLSDILAMSKSRFTINPWKDFDEKVKEIEAL